MSRSLLVAVVVALVVAVLSLGFAGLALAQGPVSGWLHGGTMGGWGAGTMMGGSNYGWMMSPEHQTWMGNGAMHDTVWNAVAGALGLSREELDQAFAQGQTLDQIARAQGKSRADLVQAFKDAMRGAVQQAVAAGQLSQAQADSMLGQMDQHAEQCLFDHMGNGTAGMMGGMMRGGGMMGSAGTPGACHGNGTPSESAGGSDL